jgi:hypothetical protein
MKQHPGTLPANIAALVELPPGGRRKALAWTGERVRAGRRTSTPGSPPPAHRD